MAKNRDRRDPSQSPEPIGFDKFKPQHGSHLPSVPEGVSAVLPVNEDDEAEGAEPTDVVPSEPPMARTPTPFDPLELNQAQTVLEQEAIIAKSHPNIRDTMRDPAEVYNRALVRGTSVPETKFPDDTDPLIVRSFLFIERMIAGAMIVPTAYQARNEGVDLLVALKNKYAVKEPEC